jgi:hypothetical protein
MRSICLQDLDFRQVPLTRRSTRGVPYQQWVRIGMPRIPANVIQSVFYLYASEEDARAGINPGGTGFIVDTGLKYDPASKSYTLPHYYGVTNHHVACDGFPVIRLNTVDGGIDVLDFNPDQWEFLPGKCDVAVIPLPSLDGKTHAVHSITTDLFVKNPADFNPYVVGDDVFMVGLFLDHAGITTNIPSARFGNISMLPNPRAKILQSTGHDGVSYVIDMHSRTGFSGSPVFAYRTFGSDLTQPFGHRFDHLQIDNWDSELSRSGTLRVSTLFNFVGIHWSQFPEELEISGKIKRYTKKQANKKKKESLPEGAYIEGMSGMTCVIPAWEILEVLNMPKFKKQRDDFDKAANRPISPKPESASPPATDENPTHREDFMRLVGAAARKPAPED